MLNGALEHRDSLGNGSSVIQPGDVQRLSAGNGIVHSEFNHSSDTPVHFLQIWFLSEKPNIKPGYEQKVFADEDKQSKFKLVVSQSGRKHWGSINQYMNMSIALLDRGKSATYSLNNDRAICAHITRGKAKLDEQILKGWRRIRLSKRISSSFL